MGFTIFPKVSRSKSAPASLPVVDPAVKAKADKGSRLAEVHTLTDMHGHGLPPSAQSIVLDEPGSLGPSLENAALMFAHGNPAAAAAALSHALDTDERSKPLVWMCLFDLLARSNDRTLFDDLALKFVVQFERSAPAWDELAGTRGAPTKPGAPQGRARSLLRGALTDPATPVLAALTEASKQKTPASQRLDVEISDLDTVSDVCGLLLAGALASFRRKGVFISFRGLDGAIHRLSGALKSGERLHKGQWYLVLELLQWAGSMEKFEDRAVEFAITFEISPPSWEPLSAQQRSVVVDAAKADAQSVETTNEDAIRWAGELKGSTDLCLRSIAVDNVTANPVVVDMAAVQRIDFVCGGAIANGFNRLMAQAIDVRVIHASPIVQALLMLTGAPAALFVKSR
jgi:anti-anti-sigma regulatory factor